MRLKNLLSSILPLRTEQKDQINTLSSFIEGEDLRQSKRLIRQKRAAVFLDDIHLPDFWLEDKTLPSLRPADEEEETIRLCKEINNAIRSKIRKKAMRNIQKDPWSLTKRFAPNIVGMKNVKRAAILQLFSKEPIHLLLLGDPGTGKTDILRSTEELADKAVFGLGSGTSGVGLTGTYKGKELVKGLLPRADEGICCIDELNLMEDKDYSALYNAMEKGFVTYDKGSKHIRMDARIQIIATANPKGDRFVGNDIRLLKQQMPFDPALLSRFHLVFLIRDPDIKEFREISRKILSGKDSKINPTEKGLIKEYVKKARAIDVSVPRFLEENMSMIAENIKKNEKNLLIAVSPRLIHGILRLVKARARMEMRSKATAKDLKDVEEILIKSLKIKKANNKKVKQD